MPRYGLISIVAGLFKSIHHAKICHVDSIAILPRPSQEVFRFNIAMDKFSHVEVFQSDKKLICKQEHGLEGEKTFAVLKQVLQAGSEELDDHDSVIIVPAIPVQLGKSRKALEFLVIIGFISQY